MNSVAYDAKNDKFIAVTRGEGDIWVFNTS